MSAGQAVEWAGVAHLLHGAMDAYHKLNATLHGGLAAILVVFLYLPPIFILERLSGGQTRQYKSVGFRHDLVYFVFHSGGGYRALQSTFVVVALAPYLKVFDLHLLDHFFSREHFLARAIVYYLIADFLLYWSHRLQHSVKLLWAFHTTHHAQRDLSFITLNRFHPIEELFLTVFSYVPLLMLGATPQDLVPLIWLYRFVVYLAHSQVQWNYGPFGKIFVSPHFHAFHHSTDPAHYNCNFGATLSLWDYCFGTAIELPERPKCYGLPDVEMPTLASSLLLPFRMVYETYFKKSERVAPAGD